MKPTAPPPYDDNQVKFPQVDDKLVRLREIATKYELAGGCVAKLRKLEKYDIVIIADDSSSMTNNAHDPDPSKPYEKVISRWEELCHRVQDVVEIATCVDSDGIDIYFLNSAPIYNIADTQVIADIFAERKPNGYTPLRDTYNRVLLDKANSEQPVLIIVATDGEPNHNVNGCWYNDVDNFTKTLKNRKNPQKSPTTIMACTDNEYEIGWLNDLDDKVPYLDVLDDYQAERQEILKAQGEGFPFSKGDYIVKTLLGPIDPIYDNLDEDKLSGRRLAEYLGRPLPRAQAYKQKNKCIIC